MSAAYALLGLLESGPSHGYDLKRTYDHLFAASRPLPFGQLYNTLARLERQERISPAGVAAGGGPERKLYVITPEGVADLEKWLTSPEAVQPHLQSVMFTKVVLALLSDRPAEPYLDAQRASHINEMRALTERRRSSGLSDSLMADFALFHLEADLRWIDVTVARLDALADEVRSR